MSMRIERCKRVVLTLSWTAALMLIGSALLWFAQVARAQETMTSPNIAPYTATVLQQRDFPTVTLEFPCREPQERFDVSENGVLITNVVQMTSTLYTPARIAILLDVYRKTDAGGDTLLPEIAAGPIAVSNVLSVMSVLPMFMPDAHKVQVFVPSAEEGKATAVTTPAWSTPPMGLINPLFGEYRQPPRRVFPAVITSTTAIYRILTDLIDTQLPLTSTGRQVILLFSDGTDELSTQAEFDRLVGLAVGRGIPIYTFYIDTAKPPDERLQRLAVATGGDYLPDASNILSMTDALDPLFDRAQVLCRISYQARVNPPTAIEIRRQGSDNRITGTVATAYLPATLRLPPPRLTIVSPARAELFTTTPTGTLPVELFWQLGEKPWRNVTEVAVVLQPLTNTEVAQQPYVRTLEAGAAQGFTLGMTLAPLQPGSYEVAAVITDNFSLTARAEQYIEIVAEPAPAPQPTPQSVSQRILRGLQDLWNWVSSDFALHSTLLYALLLPLALALFLLWRLLYWLQTRRKPNQARTQLETIVRQPAFAMLVRERRGDGDPRTLHMLQLYVASEAVSEAFKLPEYLLDPIQLRYIPAELDRFNREYSALIVCERDPVNGIDRARIQRSTTRDSSNASEITELVYKPIKILLKGSITPFDLAQGATGHELQDGEVLQFGSLCYRYVLLSGAPNRATDAAQHNGVHTNGAGMPDGVRAPVIDKGDAPHG